MHQGGTLNHFDEVNWLLYTISSERPGGAEGTSWRGSLTITLLQGFLTFQIALTLISGIWPTLIINPSGLRCDFPSAVSHAGGNSDKVLSLTTPTILFPFSAPDTRKFLDTDNHAALLWQPVSKATRLYIGVCLWRGCLMERWLRGWNMAKDVPSQLLTFWKVRDEAGASARNLLFSSSLTPYHTYALPPSPCSAHLALSQSPAQYINGRPDRRSVITLQSLGETFRHNVWDNIFFLINWAKPTMLTDKTPTKKRDTQTEN